VELLSLALRDKFDVSTPAGRLMFHVIGAMAEFERALGLAMAGACYAYASLSKPTNGLVLTLFVTCWHF
jgi:hypothetical protein